MDTELEALQTTVNQFATDFGRLLVERNRLVAQLRDAQQRIAELTKPADKVAEPAAETP